MSPGVENRWFHSLYESRLIFSGLLDSDGRVLEANRLSVEGCGLRRDEVLGRRFWECGWWSPEPDLAAQIRAWCTKSVETMDTLRAIIRYFRGDGSMGIVDLGIDPIVEEIPGEERRIYLVATGLDISDVLTAQAQREDRIASEAAAIGAERARFRAALDAMIDHVAIVRAIRDAEGRIVDFEIEYANKASVDVLGRSAEAIVGERITKLYPAWCAGGMLERSIHVVETGEAFIGEHVRLLEEGTTEPWYCDIKIAKLGDGYIAAWRDVTEAVIEEARVREVEAAAERERVAVEVLQQAALPNALPEHPSVDIGVHYQPALPLSAIGGDWYDAFHSGDHHLAFVIADVTGHGPAAGALMLQLRNALRAAALDTHQPEEILRRVNQVAIGLHAESLLTTCCFASFDVLSGELRVALAGHPPPLVVTSGGDGGYLLAPTGLPLGISPEASYSGRSRRLVPGDRVVLYTDGLIERRDESLDLSMERLREGAIDSREMPAGAAAEWLSSSLSLRLDDVALIVVDVFSLVAALA